MSQRPTYVPLRQVLLRSLLLAGTISIRPCMVLPACGLFVAGQTARASELPFVAHAIELRERVLHPEDGLLLGNGDLSVSVITEFAAKFTALMRK